MAHLLGAEALHLEFPTKVVFDSVTLGLNEGDRVGVVGKNGDGKTSLLAMLAGRLQPDAGRVTVRGGVRVGVLDQGDTLDDSLTVERAVVGDTPEHVWAGDARVRDVIRGLLADIPWDAPVTVLSGGQRRRVALAALLAGEWEVLLLDEPTNHLDVEAITWLAEHLKRRWPASAGGLLVITHDRWFLDEVCTATWEVHDRIVEPFEGGYAAYILQRVERDRMAASAEAKRQNLARKELAWLRRGAPARTSKPKFRIDAANALIADVPEIRDKVSLQSLAVARLGKDVVDLLGVSAGYDGTEVLHGVEWRIAPGERTGILGVNGAGKSTLLGLITGAIEPTAGTVKRGKTVKIAALSQRLGDLEEHLNEPVRVIIEPAPHQLHDRHRLEGAGADAERAARTARLLRRAAVHPGQGPVRRAAAPAATAADPARPAQRAHPRRADQRHGHRHARGDRGPARLVAGDAHRGLARPVLHRAGHRPAVRDPRRTAPPPARRRRRVPPAAVTGSFAGGQQSAAGGSSAARQATAVPAPSGSGPAPGSAAERAAKKELDRVDRQIARAGEREAKLHAELAANATNYEKLTELGARLAAVEAEKADLEERWLEVASSLER